MLKIEVKGMSYVAVYNLLGQMIYESQVDSDDCIVDLKAFGSGLYMVRIGTIEGFVTKKVTVIE